MIPPAWIVDPLALVGGLWLAWRLLCWLYRFDTFDPFEERGR